MNRAFILEELQKDVEDLQEFCIGHDKFWYADEADSIIDGYFGCVNQNTLNILTSLARSLLPQFFMKKIFYKK